MTRGTLETELTVFVPPEEPAGRLPADGQEPCGRGPASLRLAAYFQMVLAGQPEYSGPLEIRRRQVPQRALLREPAEHVPHGAGLRRHLARPMVVETRRGRFFGAGRSVAHPFLVEHGEPDAGPIRDDRPIAALLATLDVPAHGERTVVVVLGQADDREQAEAVIRKYRDPDAARHRPRRDPAVVARPDGHAPGPDQEPGVRPLPGLAEVPGAGRTHLGPARVLPGQRGLRLPRPASGLA